MVDEKERWGDEDGNDAENKSGYRKYGVQYAWLSSEDLISVLVPAGSGIVPAILGMVN